MTKELVLENKWEVSRSLENSLPLDLVQWRFAGGKWSEPQPILLSQKQLRAEMGLLDISGSGLAQPWIRYAEPSPVPARPIELRFTFRVDKLPENGLDLVVESAETLRDLREREARGQRGQRAGGWRRAWTGSRWST